MSQHKFGWIFLPFINLGVFLKWALETLEQGPSGEIPSEIRKSYCPKFTVEQLRNKQVYDASQSRIFMSNILTWVKFGGIYFCQF